MQYACVLKQNKLNLSRKICVELAILKQKNYYSKCINDSGNCQKSLFKIANELLDEIKQKVPPSHSDPKQLAEDFNTYYIEKVTKIRKLIPKTSEDSSYYSRPFKGKPMNVFRSVTVAEVKESKRNYQGFWYQKVYGRSNSF